jgi:hypothetical protein
MSFNAFTMGFSTLLSWLVLIGAAGFVAYMLAHAFREIVRTSSRTP